MKTSQPVSFLQLAHDSNVTEFRNGGGSVCFDHARPSRGGSRCRSARRRAAEGFSSRGDTQRAASPLVVECLCVKITGYRELARPGKDSRGVSLVCSGCGVFFNFFFYK